MLLYRLGLLGYRLLLWVASSFHPKAKLFLKGRKRLFEDLEATFSRNENPVFWIHCASLGEFEQGRSLIESWKKEHPNHKILLTFFSPSGYEIRKNYPLADAVFYLPLDSPQNAKRFLDVVRPSVAVFIKYEFWYFFLRELQRRNIPTVSVAAIFRSEQYFFKPFGGFGRKTLRLFSHFFVQDESSKKLLQKIGVTAVSVTGDTRLDRVAQIRESAKQFPEIDVFLEE
ncbi:MAG: glycosyltransferase N-terminal domain-containing protein [Bacteroidota bacterium]